ncbi:MAG TPA: HEAT repeat domain-containing protein [Myxococcaceae bacterium]|nr:HEAT repeat domain-containing protein [Myxococcaceae bacterium]
MSGERPGPGKTTLFRALPFAALLFLLVAAHTVLETARDSLFLTGQPISRLPLVFLAVTAAVLSLTPLQRFLWSTGHRGALPVTLLGTGSGTLIFWLAAGRPGAVVAFYVWTALFSSLVFVQFWLTTDEAFALGDAKKTFGFIAAGGLLGAVAGSAGARLLLQTSTPALLLPASAGLTFVAVLLALVAVPKAGTGSQTEPAAVVARAIPTILREDPYLRLLAALTLLTAASATLLDYLFKSALVAGTTAARIPQLVANVQLGQSLLALVAELLLLRILLRRAGVTRSLALLPALVLAATTGFALVGSMALLFLLKTLDGGVRPSIHRVGSELLYIPVATAERRLIKPSIDVLGQRGGQAAASVVLLVTGWAPATAQLRIITVLLATVALVWVLASRVLRSRYLVRFQAQLRAGRLESYVPGQLDLASAEILVAALGSTRTVEVLTSLELLSRSGRAELIPTLVLHHPEASVVLAALRVLAPLRRPDLETLLPLLLRHASAEVRSVAAESWGQTGKPVEELVILLDDPAPRVRASALVALSGDPARGRSFRGMLVLAARRGGTEDRRALAWAIANAPRSDLLRVALWMFQSGDRQVRQELLRASDAFSPLPSRFISRTVALLADPALRLGARKALLHMGRPARELLATLLLRDSTAFAVARELPAALAGFPPGEVAPALLARIAQPRGGLDRFRSLRALNQLRSAHPELSLDSGRLAEALDVELAAAGRDRALRIAGERLSIAGDGNPAGRLLLELLQDKETRALERVFRTLDLLLPGRQLEQAYRGTRSGRPEQQETAREVLLELLPVRWRDRLLQFLEAAGSAPHDSSSLLRPGLTAEGFVRILLRQRSELVRLLARRLARDRRWVTASPDGGLSFVLEVSGG